MKPTRTSDLRFLLAERGIRPSRALGQNFLVDENIRRIILDAAALSSSDGVLEIGPGAGALTEGLVACAGRVTAIEKDRRLYEILAERFADRPNLRLVCADALEEDLDAHLAGGLGKVVANLPYSVGTRILVELVRAAHRPERMVVTLQTEVVQRLAAEPGTADYGLLTVWARRWYDVALVRRVGGGCFFPAPEVGSAVAALRRRDAPRIVLTSEAHFEALTRAAFQRRRKQMQRVMKDLPDEVGRLEGDVAGWLEGLGIEPAARPENLPVEAWGRISNAMTEGAP